MTMNFLDKKQQFAFLKQLMEMANNPLNQASSVHQDFTEAGIEYAIVGGVALAPHNYERSTIDIDVLVSKATVSNLEKLHGRGYNLRPGATNNMFMYTATRKIPIDILVEGQVNNGIALPDPKKIRQKISGAWYASLSALISLKLEAGRVQDIADVRKLIEANELSSDYSKSLQISVRDKFLSLLK